MLLTHGHIGKLEENRSINEHYFWKKYLVLHNKTEMQEQLRYNRWQQYFHVPCLFNGFNCSVHVRTFHALDETVCKTENTKLDLCTVPVCSAERLAHEAKTGKLILDRQNESWVWQNLVFFKGTKVGECN